MVLVGKPEGKRHLEDRGIDHTIILKWISKKLDWDGEHWINFAQDVDK
jgi:hypothetical protein